MNYWKIIMLILFCYRMTNAKLTNPFKIKHPLQNWNIIQTKGQSLIKIIRPQNIVPTLFLCFTGGWITNPSIKQLLSSPTFIVSSLNTIQVMSSSMVINDIFDLEIDKINNPTRPLVTGELTKKEAILFNCIIIGSIELLSFFYLTNTLNLIVNLALLNVTLYTPIFKKIVFVKNLSCAFLVSFSLFFSGLATTNIQNMYTITMSEKTKELLWIASRTIFFGSLYNELLLDMHDYEGDKQNKIYTIPVIFGLNNSLVLANRIMKVNIVWHSLKITQLYNYKYGLLFFCIISPMLHSLKEIKQSKFSKKSIYNAIKKTNIPLFLVLSYLCLLVKII